MLSRFTVAPAADFDMAGEAGFPSVTRPEWAILFCFPVSYFSGSLLNFSAQWAQQK
jgi:hypothetical protein